tara:strand:- start:24 stop:263 length:240 start_codon:yes stop_codon:yes gene_type:complete
MARKLYEIIAKVLDVPISEINDESNPETIENWDSFNGLVLVDELEDEYKIKFGLNEIVESNSVKDIKKYLKIHGVNTDD